MFYNDPAYKSISNSPTQYSIEFNPTAVVIKPYDPNTSGGVSPKAHQIRLQMVHPLIWDYRSERDLTSHELHCQRSTSAFGMQVDCFRAENGNVITLVDIVYHCCSNASIRLQ